MLTQREIANQEIETFKEQKEAQDQAHRDGAGQGHRPTCSASWRGRRSASTIKTNNAGARKAEADGEATYIAQTGRAKGAEVEAVGLARAKGFEAQVEALGPEATTMVNTITELVKSGTRFVPDILVSGASGGGDAMTAGVMGFLREFQRQRGGTAPAAK